MYYNKKAVIFDLDGTLVDSMWIWKTIDEEYLGEHGLTVPDDLQDGIGGRSFTETAVYFKERFALKDTVEEIKKRWNDMAISKYRNCVPLKNGVLNLLKNLQQNAMKIGLASSNSIELIETVLDVLAVRKYFQEIHCSCEVSQGKPAPDIYLLVASRLGVKPEECLVFEDVLEGVQAGKAAGMTVCAVRDEWVTHPEEARALADYYIEDFEQIENILQNGD